MQIINTRIADVRIFQAKVFGDERGFFLETFEANRYKKELNIDWNFVQDNHSRSSKGVLRGLHFKLKILKVSLFVAFVGKYLMWPLIFVKAQPPMANGQV